MNRFLPLAVGVFALMAMNTTQAAAESYTRPPGMPQLEVVADHGGEPARPWFVAISGSGVDDADQAPAAATPQKATEADMLPVKSELLTPGRVATQRLNLPAGFPAFFIVGNDALSKRWLRERGNALRDMHAVGLVVNVDNASDMNTLRQVGEGIEMHPVKGDDLAERLHLNHYPVLVSEAGLQQ
ncbi:integrating conjugative element protein [Carnimonas bestiolae]|uniref:integrating conjugative element protein n=1 Tax=Carnimonas bestiolae TaxID=3402172 RepID=UPI003EDC19DF